MEHARLRLRVSGIIVVVFGRLRVQRIRVDFELAAGVELQIVCFRPRACELDGVTLDRITDEAVIRLQESGVAVISSTTVFGKRAMRVCITNHRTEDRDLGVMLEELRRITRGAIAEARG